MADSRRARARTVFRGHVQGVGFRFAARRSAESFAVTGYVQNEPDGTVELVAEGERGEVEAFLDAVAREMAPYIRSREVTWSVATGEFDGFGVRHAW